MASDTMQNAGRVDTHVHIVPPDYRKWLMAQGFDAGGMPIPEWTAERALENMEGNEIGISVLSVSTPGVEPAKKGDARSLARDLNEYTASVVAGGEGKFEFMATLIMDDIEGSLMESSFALDKLGAKGVIMPAHLRNAYLGAPEYEDLLAELNRRAAVVFVHPSEFASDRVKGLPAFAADFLLDTVRAAVNLARSGCLDRYPDIKFLLANAGGFLPYAARRLAATASPQGSEEDGLRLLKKFYFETSIASTKYSLPSLLAFAAPGHIVFGSDFPYAPREVGEMFTAELDGFKGRDLDAINFSNARRLFKYDA